ncbi:hypothetical protein A3A14_03160 [Candidatus Daviesbacteria bacterium RIFCSPLOWO2_01_FULL_43_38]|uniref:Pyruvate, water dikinase n=2 Tax=Candidatus Daviesiibacteriota TaxID=1752718 RepID=A0A1F5K090_9BACT|nr:MAG: Phosphoenolpyruvate synthase [Candidatus Daviesbacteria bacterium GW2011_GWA1_42_6]OGE20063.1 MAG: hypothetical protein A2874_01110 [Candidatus Daviesbacteria bacterium RIFCSPHIGHO2_01_FULL_43_17]OGE34150.1 MAG: hypothetical protein A3E45_01810 [Candidatus Daviesbacteria bacterium RIFCSPHIGHO2_12_FULL_43_11]OGE63479.1 MAG: hypothetical protein A3A14_03160 [Candidatus Daviesbacteria bacterium RIFCSPLOWO2_01_FULL_43_38]OGE70827.1 MAG: hypothetical protein A3J21_01025 [Candidatus Daviesbac
MTNILPIKFISESDQPEYGVTAYNLSRLERAGFPIAPGFAVCPPEIIFQTVLEHFKTASREVFQQRLAIVKSKIGKIPLSPELDKVLGRGKGWYLKGGIFKTKKELWQALFNIWLNQAYARIWQEGFNSGLLSSLTSQLIFLVEKQIVPGSAFFDPNLGEVIIKASGLNPESQKLIGKLVIEGNKKLFLPYIYEFISIKGKILLVGLAPFTQTLPVSKTEDIVIPQNIQKKAVKSAVKVFFNLSSGFSIPGMDLDGVLIEAERVLDLRQTDRRVNFENLVFKLAESALSFTTKPVIYRLPDILDGDIDGALRLIHQKSLLDLACDAFLFVRNKKNLLNVELGIPGLRSADELVRIKQELAARGINRKGTLRFWQEVFVPENLINLEDYLAVGIDGVILNLDRLQLHLGGYKVTEGEFYRKQVAALVKFIGPAFKILHKARIHVLAKGELCIYPDILDCLIEGGVWGIVANTEIEAESLPEHLNWSERRMVAKRFA